MNLYIISPCDTDKSLLAEAYASQDISCKAHDNISQLPDAITADDFFIIAVSIDNVEEIKAFAARYPVYALCDKEIDPDPVYEEIFIRPFRLGDVVEKISQAMAQHKIYKELSPVTLGNLTLNPQTSFLGDASKKVTIRLTEKELAIILYLNKNKNATRDALLQNIWGYKNDIETHTLETHLYRLRQKIQKTFGYNFLITDDDGYHLNFEAGAQ